MIILIFLVSTTHQTLIYQFDANSNNGDGFEISGGGFSTCGGIHLLGSINYGGSQISKLFLDLDPHSHIILEAHFIKIDLNWNYYILIDEQYVNYVGVISSQNQICGGAELDILESTFITSQHNRRTTWIQIRFFAGQGLISLKLSIAKCWYECVGCIENNDRFQIDHKFCEWTFGTSSYYNYFLCENCEFLQFQVIKYSTLLPPHQDILIKFFKLDGYTIILDYLYGKYIINSINYVTILIRNHPDPILILNIKTQLAIDSYIRDFEVYYTQPEIIFNNLNLNEGCLEQIDDKCLICLEGWIQDQFLENCHQICSNGIIKGQYCYNRDFEVTSTQPVIKVNKVNEGCLEQIDNQCLTCKQGWIQDKFLENCHPICGDGIIQGQEECDDANSISNDSCFLCKYSCTNFCKTCEFGICFECVFGFDLNPNFNCVPLCGDGNVVPYSAEQCDLTDNGEWDDCQDCRFILIANCKRQLLSMCLVCEKGYQLQANACFPHCGDKFILQQYEECDDGNLQPYDGCFQCKFQCAEDCNICDRGQCILQCEAGYKFVNNTCLSVCGDQIVTKEEDCDDGNRIQFDGCFNCKYSYSCPENCYDCYQGTCLECNNEYQLLISNQCKLQQNCGDGLLQKQEECDDANYLAVDGCKDCLIEQNWICLSMIRDSPSQCAPANAPKLVINYLNMTSNNQYISIQFNQQVKIDKKNWNSRLYIILDVGSYVSFGEYVIEIEIHQLLEFRPVLKILVNQTVANIDNAVLYDFHKSITLQYPQYLDETQSDYSQKLKSLNTYLIYGLSGVTAVNLLSGNGNLFVEILTILQTQQYLRYINLQFPENLEIYFSINDLITIQPLLEFIDFPQLFQFIELQQNQQPYSEGKFNVYKYNPSLIINLSCQILQCLILLFLILLYQLIKKVIYKWIFCSRNFYFASSLSLCINPKIIFKFYESFYNICLNLLNLNKFMSFQGLQKALLLNGWDMIFKTLYYTRNIYTNNYLDITQLIIAIIILFLYFTILLDSFKCKQNYKRLRDLKFQVLEDNFFFYSS